MTTTTVTKAKANLDAVLQASQRAPVVLTRNGKPVALLLGGKTPDEIERILMACSPRLNQILDDSETAINSGLGLTEDEFWSHAAPKPLRPKHQKPASKRSKHKS